mmetsp:Transcript_2494/g.8374  ORF Transcript_2494/g.8374 Transcript_2494/m.8374 type:complete len:229 (-) Transcript_2494:1504-2190(-)
MTPSARCRTPTLQTRWRGCRLPARSRPSWPMTAMEGWYTWGRCRATTRPSSPSLRSSSQRRRATCSNSTWVRSPGASWPRLWRRRDVCRCWWPARRSTGWPRTRSGGTTSSSHRQAQTPSLLPSRPSLATRTCLSASAPSPTLCTTPGRQRPKGPTRSASRATTRTCAGCACWWWACWAARRTPPSPSATPAPSHSGPCRPACHWSTSRSPPGRTPGTGCGSAPPLRD